MTRHEIQILRAGGMVQAAGAVKTGVSARKVRTVGTIDVAEECAGRSSLVRRSAAHERRDEASLVYVEP